MSKKPAFVLKSPEPVTTLKQFNTRRLIVWECEVKISSIKGWVENPRIELARKRIQQKTGLRELGQDEVADLMKNDPDVKLKQLRDDIIKNGLRVPLTLSFNGKLLDGNRRFFAIKYALESMSSTNPNRQDLEKVKAIVLSENASEEDEHNVLVEENFSPSLKIEWPDYVKSRLVVQARDHGLTNEEIAKKFNWDKSKVSQTLRINEIIEDFLSFVTSDPDPEDNSGGGFGLTQEEADDIAAKNYQYFNEAQKSFFNPLKTDIEFKIQFFKWIYSEKFSSFSEVRVAYLAWKHPEAKAILMQPDPTSAKSAKTILEYNTNVARNTEEVVGRIESFVTFLNKITAVEISKIPTATKDNLQKALQLVIKLSSVIEDN